MSREIKRVPLDFEWPIDEPWAGFVMPERLEADACPACENGYSPTGKRLKDEWYGNAPFSPRDHGSAPFLPDGPEAKAWAKRQCEQSPDYYGVGPLAEAREARRICRLWNASWSHHLNQGEVDALLAEGRLREFTHDFVKGTGWVPKPEPVEVTAASVNSWSTSGFGHDGINMSIALEHRAAQEGVSYVCSTCGGSAEAEAYPGQKAEAEAWTETPIPEGSGWQLWETVSEGSPQTRVYATAEELAHELFLHQDLYLGRGSKSTEADLLAWVTGPGWAPSLAVSL